ncbi:uncharacterized protein LOC125646604 [Ostrea edulis]|uniref:uncharacterized protein LOC125646604 n=1 Tax=Ostrea edulis TaxID=37623 RepID=UPI0020940CC2|nr:uncharacterized protein LOC125646604 [Ostrea edulis]
MGKKNRNRRDLHDHKVTYVVSTDEIHGITGLYSRYSQCGLTGLEASEMDHRTAGKTLAFSDNETHIEKDHRQLKIESLRDEVLKNLDKINQLKFEILSKENGSYTSNNGKGRVKSVILNSTLLGDLESEMVVLKNNVEHAQNILLDYYGKANLNMEEFLTLHRTRCIEPDTVYLRDICDKSANIKISRSCYSSNIHIERCTDVKNHIGWIRSKNLVSISGCFTSPKIYLSGLFVNPVISVRGIAGQPEIHIKGVCIAPRILVSGTKLKPTVFIDGVVIDPYLQVDGLVSRLKLNVTGICFRQNAILDGFNCQTKLRVFGMCSI